MDQFIEFVTNHWLLWTAFFAVAFALAVNLTQGGRGLLEPQQLVNLINRDGAVTIDVRSEAEYASGHIIDAVHVPLDKLDSSTSDLERFKDKPVVVYCGLGNQSPRAEKQLRAAGFEQVYRLRGGLGAWRQANLPTAN